MVVQLSGIFKELFLGLNGNGFALVLINAPVSRRFILRAAGMGLWSIASLLYSSSWPEKVNYENLITKIN